MAKVRLTTTNYVDPDLVSSAYVSSEQAAFPVDNLYNAQRRSKVWRSNGHFEVTTATRNIVFRETALGPDLTAQVIVGHYADSDAFLTAVENALNAAGASVYTAEIDPTTLKIKIESDGGGGGGIFTLRWTHADSAGFAGIAGFATDADDTGSLEYTADVLRLHTDERITWDFGISSNPKAMIAIGLRNQPIKISPSAAINFQGNETDVWTAPSDDLEVAYDDEALLLMSATGLFEEARRYASLRIYDPENARGYVELGAIFVGDVFEPTVGAAIFPFSGGKIDRSTTTISEGGQTFSDQRQKAERFQIAWQHLTFEEKEAIDALWDQVGTGVPFFVIADPDRAFSSRASKYVRYCKFEAEPAWELVTPNNFSYAMNLREEL